MMKKLLQVGLVTALVFPALVSATTYEFYVHDYGVNNGNLDTGYHNPAAGYVEHLTTKFNDSTQQLSASLVLTDTLPANVTNQGAYAISGIGDGVWMVLTDGKGPKHGSTGEYAILYADSNSGNITSYVYSGNWSHDSWKRPGEFIQSFEGAFSTVSVAGQTTYNFDINVSGINSYTPSDPDDDGWKGIQFGEEIGIWVHPFFNDVLPTFNSDGSIATMAIGGFGWFDSDENSPLITSAVPIPTAIWLFGSGLAGLIAAGRRKFQN